MVETGMEGRKRGARYKLSSIISSFSYAAIGRILVAVSLQMPLIILSGTPCTGKTTFAHMLAEALRAYSDKLVIVINEGRHSYALSYPCFFTPFICLSSSRKRVIDDKQSQWLLRLCQREGYACVTEECCGEKSDGHQFRYNR